MMRLILGSGGVDQCTYEDPVMVEADCENPVTQNFGGNALGLCYKHALKPACTHIP